MEEYSRNLRGSMFEGKRYTEKSGFADFCSKSFTADNIVDMMPDIKESKKKTRLSLKLDIGVRANS
jgi:hypothetical protein